MSALALGKSVFGTNALSASKLFDVSRWVCIVTGGGTGLGLVTAAVLAENGAKVYITGRRLQVLQDAAKMAQPSTGKGSIVPIQADVATKEGILNLRSEIQKNDKWVNLLVNNAGVSEPHGEIDSVEQTPEAISEEMFGKESFETWSNTHRINTTSCYFTTFGFLPMLVAAQKTGGFSEPGNVLNIASLSGICRTSQHGQFNYNSGKAATRHLSLMMSTDFARRGFNVRVNCLNPGYFPSGMSVKETGNVSEEELLKLYEQKYMIPFGRPGTAQEYAQLVMGVVVNGYMTGADIVIDGGWLATQPF